MKQGRFSNEQIVRIPGVTDLDSVAVVAKRHGVSDPPHLAREVLASSRPMRSNAR